MMTDFGCLLILGSVKLAENSLHKKKTKKKKKKNGQVTRKFAAAKYGSYKLTCEHSV